MIPCQLVLVERRILMNQSNIQNLPKLLSTKELARVLNMSHRSLENMRQRGVGPKFIKVGRTVRYAFEDVLDWIPGLSLRH